MFTRRLRWRILSPIYIADYGKHSSLLLPTGTGTLVEYSFGDWDWYVSNSVQVKDAIRALLFSRGAAFGRRELPAPDAGDHDLVDLQQQARCLHVVTLHVERARAEDLACALEERFGRHRDSAVYNELAELTLVRDDEHYGITHTCNHATADWLRVLGCRVDGLNVLSNFVVESSVSSAASKPAP